MMISSSTNVSFYLLFSILASNNSLVFKKETLLDVVQDNPLATADPAFACGSKMAQNGEFTAELQQV